MKILVARVLCGKPARYGPPCGLDKDHAKRGERHDNGKFTWALRGSEAKGHGHGPGKLPSVGGNKRKAKHMAKAKSVAGNFDEIWDRLADEGKCDLRGCPEYHRVRAAWNKAGGDVEKFIQRQAKLPHEDAKACDDKRDGSDARCTKPKGHGGMHYSDTDQVGWSDGWREPGGSSRAPAKPTPSAKAEKPSKNANIQTGRSAGLKFTDNTRIFGYRSHPIAALWPLLEGDEFAELVESIRARGLDEDIVLVVVDGETLILDGRNRGRACLAAKVKPRFTKYIGKKDLDSIRSYVDARNKHRRQLSKSQLALIGAEGDRLCRGNSADRTDKSKTQAARAKGQGLSERLQRKADRVVDNATAKVKEAVRKGKMSVEAAEPLSKLPHKKQDELAESALAGSGEIKSGKIKTLVRQEHKRDVVRKINNAQVHPMPIGPFRAIVIDPPWPYENSDQHEGSRGHIPYPPMPIADIMRMRPDLDKLVHEDGTILFMWVTNHFVHEVGRILEAWGFTHRTMLTWDKGKTGTGSWPRGRTEHVIIATRGTLIHTLNEIDTLFGGKVREHSRKPDKLSEIIEQHCQGPFVELFAQEPRTNWAAWGAETNKFKAQTQAQGAA